MFSRALPRASPSLSVRASPSLVRTTITHLPTPATATSAATIRTLRTLSRPTAIHQQPQHSPLSKRQASHTPPLVRWASGISLADEKIEEITELFATAKDEFEIAAEETQNNTVYAEDDRAAAREELTKLQEAYAAVLEGRDRDVAEEVKRRIGHRIRELENAVVAMEEMAMNQD
ncbi:hypothetical protein BDV97DRAFT_403366 [Delphinella strobiligena]|nr:hypothetical protein BDV97DRAFT_403366 [Delphinella strobiligena]